MNFWTYIQAIVLHMSDSVLHHPPSHSLRNNEWIVRGNIKKGQNIHSWIFRFGSHSKYPLFTLQNVTIVANYKKRIKRLTSIFILPFWKFFEMMNSLCSSGWTWTHSWWFFRFPSLGLKSYTITPSFPVYFQDRSHYVVKAGLKLLGCLLSQPPRQLLLQAYATMSD